MEKFDNALDSLKQAHDKPNQLLDIVKPNTIEINWMFSADDAKKLFDGFEKHRWYVPKNEGMISFYLHGDNEVYRFALTLNDDNYISNELIFESDPNILAEFAQESVEKDVLKILELQLGIEPTT